MEWYLEPTEILRIKSVGLTSLSTPFDPPFPEIESLSQSVRLTQGKLFIRFFPKEKESMIGSDFGSQLKKM